MSGHGMEHSHAKLIAADYAAGFTESLNAEDPVRWTDDHHDPDRGLCCHSHAMHTSPPHPGSLIRKSIEKE